MLCSFVLCDFFSGTRPKNSLNFQQKYPFLKPSIIRLGGNALLSRILTEAKAGKNFFDVVHGTGEIVLPLMDMGLIASYASPERKMIPDDLKDKRGFWTSVYVNSVVLGYNTNLTKGQPIPRSYDDLLQPRWKGRKISIDSTYVTFLQGWIAVWGNVKALEYLKKFADQDPVVMRGSTVRAQRKIGRSGNSAAVCQANAAVLACAPATFDLVSGLNFVHLCEPGD